jgi:hypothetical protein
MHDALPVKIDQCPQQLGHHGSRALLIGPPGDNPLEEFSPFAELQNEDVARLVIIDFEETGDVGVVEVYHNRHFFK